jgi:hypothetical protein
MPGGARDDNYDDDDGGDDAQPSMSAPPGESAYGTREPQPFIPRDAQPFPQTQVHQPRPQPVAPQNDGDVDRLPSFITGGHQPQPSGQNLQGQNGHDNQPDRFPLHRRRRRHRGPRHDVQGGGDTGGDESSPRGE